MLSFKLLPTSLVYFLTATLFPLIEANLAILTLHSGTTFRYGPFFCGVSSIVITRTTSLFASAIDSEGTLLDNGTFGSGKAVEISALLKYVF